MTNLPKTIFFKCPDAPCKATLGLKLTRLRTSLVEEVICSVNEKNEEKNEGQELGCLVKIVVENYLDLPYEFTLTYKSEAKESLFGISKIKEEGYIVLPEFYMFPGDEIYYSFSTISNEESYYN